VAELTHKQRLAANCIVSRPLLLATKPTAADLMLLLLQCDLPWSAPFLDSYKGGSGKTLNLTMCNWYLPQGPNVPALYRCEPAACIA
jgi:hypothetical protein